MSKNKSNKTPKVRILPLSYDIIFKRLFGDKRNVVHLKNLLKTIITTIPEDEYDDITFIDTQLKRETQDDKLSIVDIMLTTKSKNIIHIELQIIRQEEFAERILYYLSKMIATQLGKGQNYSELKKIICIVITDFDMFPTEKYDNWFRLCNTANNAIFTDLIEIHTFELNKLPKVSDNSDKYDWLKFIIAKDEEEFDVVIQNNVLIRNAYEELKRISQIRRLRNAIDYKERARRDEVARNKYSERVGMEKGRKDFMQETIEKMRKMGIPEEKINDIFE